VIARPSPRRPCHVLVYYPGQAAQYAALIRAPRGRVAVSVVATPEEAARVIADVDVIYGWKLPPALLAKATRLTWVQVAGAGVDWALVPELASGVTVTRTPGIFGPWMAEYVLGWMLWVTQRMAQYLDAQRERRWHDGILPDALRGQTLAIVGLGDIGRTVARFARGLGVRAIGVSRSGRPVPGVRRVWRLSGLSRALGEADFVALTVPLTAQTRGLIGAHELAAMRPHAWLLNVARGEVVDDKALVDALERGTIAGAILDVVTHEPLPDDDPLWRAPNVVITPHISGPTTPAEVAPIFNDNLARFVARRTLRHVVDRARGY
jgi:glyoxylate/hydroxypyruvate reductase A